MSSTPLTICTPFSLQHAHAIEFYLLVLLPVSNISVEVLLGIAKLAIVTVRHSLMVAVLSTVLLMTATR